MENARGDHITIEVDALANELKNTMRTTNLTMSPQRCIFKVPNILERHNPKAYAPNAFSIGPYHYGEEHLQATQKIKLKYLHDLVFSFEDPDTVLRTLIGAISKVQQKARACYGDPFDHISAPEFVKILVLDGCFLIQLFRKNADEKLQKDDDPVFTVSCMSQLLGHDLILLENQIPWMVLELLYDIITRKLEDPSVKSLNSLVLGYCRHTSTIFGKFDAVIYPFLPGDRKSNKHILDLLRNSLVLPSSIKEKKSMVQEQTMPSATRLMEAGIRFNENTSQKSILDIEFERTDGVLKIPPLAIHEDTESLFRNLICLEQCLPNCTPVVTCYAILLDNLINTTEDVELLCKSGIIDNHLNVDDAARVFNQLYDDAYIKEFYYEDLITDVDEYCKHNWPRYRAVLMRDYFKHPWAVVSVVAATILLILTFLQTFFTIKK
ncbi:hypothetical protein TIFTF001_046074 [Ficus carica]|uniref:Uncharacterized protein n=1 Tax=Ficus carica TaxID=3494 RepID=A0AA87Z6G8_FICCA|nr:hypothetical protein TIFTF001_046074 [Ficus carica]